MKSVITRLGPGLLYAGAAVGVSHLVQSTRAGAEYGLLMVVVVFLANLLKYPFFKAGPTYAAAKGKSLLEAFHAEGKWAMLLFYAITVSAVFTVQAVVTLLTSSVLASIFNLQQPLWLISAFVLSFCAVVLLIGRYKLLDRLMKVVIILLTITTLVSLFAALQIKQTDAFSTTFSFFSTTDVFFLIALIGWMPAPLDIALWHSEWTLKESEESGEPLQLKKSLFDFRIGYWGTTFLAMAFVGLGSLILKNVNTELPAGGAAFAGEIIGMYTRTLGKWSFAFIAIAAFTTMFSTTLTVLDAYPRVLQKAVRLSGGKGISQSYSLYLFLVIIGALFVLIFQLENMKQLVDFATTISFLTAPLMASLIYRVVKKSKLNLFNSSENILAVAGLIFLYCFSIYYLYVKFLSS